MENVLKSRTAIEMASLEKIIYSYVIITYTNKKITCMTHVVKLDTLTGYEDKVIRILFCRLFFIAYLSKNHEFSQNVYSLL